MTPKIDEPAYAYAIEKKYGGSAVRFHHELVSALRRASNELARDVLRKLIQDVNCGRFHDQRAKPVARRRLLIESIRSIPHDGELRAWRRDIIERLRNGMYSEAT